MGAISEDEIMSRIGELQRRMGEEAAGVDWDAVTRIVPELNRINKNMLDEGISLKMFDDAMEETVRGNDSYLFREYIGKVRDGTGNVTKSFNQADDLTQGLVDNLGGSSFNKGRSVRFEDDLVRFLNEQKDLMLEPAAFKRMIKRAERQGSAVTRAKIAQEVLGAGYTTLGASADPIMKIVGAMSETDPQFAQLLKAMTGTMRQRRGLFPLLAKVNKAFKPAAVYNLFIPKVSSIPRNLIGGAWGAGSVIGYDEAMRQIKNMPRNTIDSLGVYWKQATRPLHGKKDVLDIHGATAGGVAEAIGETPEFGGRLGDDIRFVASMEGLPMDQRIAKARERNSILAEAIEYGVLDGFVASEQLLKQHFRNRTLQNIADVATAPGAAFGHAEGAMRYATYKAMRESGISVKAARAMQEDAFLDYSVNFIENRTLRDLVPFAAFATGTIAQQSKLLAKRPAVGVAMAQLYGQNTDFPLMPWLQGTPSFSYGENEDGTPLVAAGLGLPFEALGLIPDLSGDPRDLGSSVRSGIVGSSHPFIKAAYGYTTGQDPFFGGAYGAYDKTPYSLQALGMSERNEFSRLYREMSNTGLIQPLVSVMNTFDRLLDPRMSLDAKAVNLLTGMRIVANDPDNAAYRILQDRLAGDPTVRQHIQYSGGSEEIDGVLKALRDAQKRLKEKREAKEEAKLAE